MNVKYVPIADVAHVGFNTLLCSPFLEQSMNEDSFTSYLKLKTI